MNALKLLALSVVATLSLIALAAPGAQAGEIRILGTEAAVGQEFTGTQEGTAQLLVTNLGFELRCTASDTLEGKILASGSKALGLIKILFLGCTAWSGGKEVPACHVLEITTGTEKDFNMAMNLELILEGTSTFIKASKLKEEGGLGKFKFTAGLGCTLPSPIEIRGPIIFKVVTGNLNGGPAVVEPLIQSNGELLDASLNLALKGKNVGCTWGML